MEIIKWKEKEVLPTVHEVDVRNLYDSEPLQIIHISLQPGESLKRHVTPVDVVFYVLEGKGIVEIGDEKMEVEKDALIPSPKDIPHTWYNQSDSVLRFLVIKAPRPDKPSKVL